MGDCPPARSSRELLFLFLVGQLLGGAQMDTYHLALNVEVQEVRRMSRTTQWMAREELSAGEQGARIAMFSKIKVYSLLFKNVSAELGVP